MRSLKKFGRVVTPTGWAALYATVAALWAGAVLSWIEGWALAISGVTVLLSAALFLLGSRGDHARLAVDALHTSVGGTVKVGITLTNASPGRSRPTRALLRVGESQRQITVPAVSAATTQELKYEISAAHRGVLSIGPLTVSRSDPLEIYRHQREWPERYRVHVHPDTVVLPPTTAGLVRDVAGRASTQLTDSDLAFHGVREYASGDAMRHIHWKATAKQGNLMVRQYEESRSTYLSVLFDRQPGVYLSDDGFELGVSAAASISVQAVREGRQQSVAYGCAPNRRKRHPTGIVSLPTRTPAELLNTWAECTQAPQVQPIEELVRQLAPLDHAHSVVCVITGEHTSLAKLHRSVAHLCPGTQLLVVRAVPCSEPQLRRVHALTVVTIGELGDLPRLFSQSGV